ncbi:MAG: hypothetical protein WAS05_00225 [Candidatus Nanopelagicales bacterium]
MALLAAQTVPPHGLAPELVAAGNHTAPAGTRNFLVVDNGGGSSINLTIVTPFTDNDGNAIADAVIPVDAGDRSIIPLKDTIYGSIAAISFSSTSDVTCGVITV